MNHSNSQLQEVEVAHICLFEQETNRVLLQFKHKFKQMAFVWGKTKQNESKIQTIQREMDEETGYSLLQDRIFPVQTDEKIIGGKKYKGSVFAGYLPKGFQPIDTEEGRCAFYDIPKAPLDDFITWDSREVIARTIQKCFNILQKS